VYTGSVNSSTNLPVNNFVLPQLTDYFPSGNPLRSCTTASLVEYTPNPQPVLVKRAPQPAPINTFPGVPDLADSITYTAEANRVEPSPTAEPTPDTSSDDGEASATEDNGGSTNPPATSSEEAPSPSQQESQTASESQAPPPSQQESQTETGTLVPPSAAQGATYTQAASPSATASDGSVQISNTALGTMTLTGSSTQIIGNSTSSQPSTWNYVCSAEGCTLASSSGATASSANASSTSTESVSQTAQSSSARNVPVYGVGTMFLIMVLFVLLG
jgi:hypothetical protein